MLKGIKFDHLVIFYDWHISIYVSSQLKCNYNMVESTVYQHNINKNYITFSSLTSNVLYDTIYNIGRNKKSKYKFII